MFLDYTIEDAQERISFLNNSSIDSNSNLEECADYILASLPKTKSILTNNRLATINRRETSLEGICEKMETGENGLHNILSDLGKRGFLTQKNSITKEDIEKNTALKELVAAIAQVESQYAAAEGKRKQLLKRQLIQMRQDQYVLKNGFKKTFSSTTKVPHSISYDSRYYLDEDGEPHTEGFIDIFNENHIHLILNNYTPLKNAVAANLSSDLWYIMQDFDDLAAAALRDTPYLQMLLTLKTEGWTNAEIQAKLVHRFGKSYTIEHISNLWCHKIPKLIKERAVQQFLEWYYTEIEYGSWKRCSCCCQVKLANPHFFTRNCTSADGFYSICKECRAKKRRGEK